MKPWVLVINAGSSSLKYQVFDASTFEIRAKGVVERIGENGFVSNHDEALELVVKQLVEFEVSLEDIDAVGHRVVHGGAKFKEPVLIDDGVIAEIESLVSLAPLHNPAHLAGIKGLRKLLPNTPQVAVFDTAFHTSIPDYASTYAIPTSTSEKFGIKKYGFHGTSHEYVASQTANFIGKSLHETSLIICHIGNGASVTAVLNGKSIDTSMGFTPLEGLVMGTRSGDIDPGVVFHLASVGGLSLAEIDELLNKQSGLLGLAGSVDMREIWQRERAGDATAKLTREIYAYRIQKYISAYLGLLPNISGVVFTAGVGENDYGLREMAIKPLAHLGLQLSNEHNQSSIKTNRKISHSDSKIGIYVIPTNEEVAIAKAAISVLH